jgi:RNA polymerase sigma-70 factor (ECF subfamily)
MLASASRAIFDWVMSPSRAARFQVAMHALSGSASACEKEADSDDLLIEAFERGDRRVASRIYDKLIGIVDSTLYRILGTHGHDHDDLVQSAFEQIMLSLVRRQFARACSLSSWACTVTTHLALNALRARTRERSVIDRAPDAALEAPSRRPEDDVERAAGTREELARLRVHLARITPEKAEALVLHDVLGHGLEEVAALSGVSITAAQSRLLRGRRELQRRVLEDATRRARTGQP